MEEEVWKDIEGYSRYKISNLARVWDSKTDKEVTKVLTGKPQYYYVNMNRDDGKRKLVRLHRLVADAFVPNPEDKNLVDHIDQDKLNNLPHNLRWSDEYGNSRNTSVNLYYEGELLVDTVADIFGEQYNKRIYQYIRNRIVNYKEDLNTAINNWKVKKKGNRSKK